MAEDDQAAPGGPQDAGAPEERDPWAPVERRTSLEKPSGFGPPAPADAPLHGTLEYGPDEQPTIEAAPSSGAIPTAGFGPVGPASGGWSGPAGPVPPPPPAPAEFGPGGPTVPGYGGYPPQTVPMSHAGPAGMGVPGGYPGHPGYPGYGGMGAPAGYGYGWPGAGMMPQNGIGTAALVLGILSICLFFLYGIVPVVLGTLAVVFGVKGRRRADRGEATNPGQAQAGLVTGIVGIVLGIIAAILIVIGISQADDEDGSTYGGDSGYAATLWVTGAGDRH